MTNPLLSISTPEDIGRVYQMPGGGFEKNLTKKAAKQGLMEGKLFPSITNVIGRSGKDWSSYQRFMTEKALREGKTIKEALNAGNDWRDYAAERGTAVHKLIEDYIDSGKATYPYFPSYKNYVSWDAILKYEAERYVEGFTRFCHRFTPTWIEQEMTVYGTTGGAEFNYAGTTDFVAEIEGELFIGDWKNSSSLHNTVSEQLNAVRKSTHKALDSELQAHDLSDHRMIAVRFFVDKETGHGDYEVKEADHRGWDIFRASRAKWGHNTFEGTMLTSW